MYFCSIKYKFLSMRRVVLSIAIATLILCGCGVQTTDSRPTITVSILPLKQWAERIVGDSVRVNVLVPPGSSPEMFEPTPRQMSQFSQSELFFAIGLIDFEQVLIDKFSGQSKPCVVNLAQGGALIEGHHHYHHGHECHHAADPHIWTSCREAKRMVGVMANELAVAYPRCATLFRENAQAFIAEIDSLDAQICAVIDGSERSHFLIFHPALAYFARDYGLTQLCVEDEGKEPSALGMAEIVETAKRTGVSHVLVQQQFDTKSAHTIADALQLPVVQVDPLAEDWLTEMLRMAHIIAGTDRR